MVFVAIFSAAVTVPARAKRTAPSGPAAFNDMSKSNRRERIVDLGSFLLRICLDVSKNSGTPQWMVYFMENPIKMDDLGVALFLETPI